MSRAVDRGRLVGGPPTPPAPLTLPRPLSSRSVTVHHGASLLRHLHGHRRRGAVGVRPFLPALVAGGLAAANVEIHFNSTDFFFLQSAPFLLGMAVGAIVLALIERRRIESQALTVVLAVIAPRSGRCGSRARWTTTTTRTGPG